VPERLCQDMREFLEALNKWRAEYLVIGAHAVGVYAEPRSTKDLDIWVNPTKGNAKRVFAALKEFGAPLFGTTEKTLTERDNFLTIGIAPNRIDILKSIPGVEFRACWKNRRTFEVEGTTANFLALEDLIAAKEAAKRPQDLVDAEKLRKALVLEKKQQEQAPGPRGPVPESPKSKPGRSPGRQKGGGRGPKRGKDREPGVEG
jgi:hypothetical protein